MEILCIMVRMKKRFYWFATFILAMPTVLSGSVPGMPDEIVMSARFSTDRGRRAVHDVPANLDLTGALGFVVDFKVDSLSQFSGFDIHFKSGSGWYCVHFLPEKEGVFERIFLPFKDMKKEGEPKGLNEIERVRISGWRAGANDATVVLRNFSFADEKAIAAIEAAKDRRPVLCRMPENGEFRAFWCHSAYGLQNGHDWDSSIALLKRLGFNAIIVNFAWPGVAYYRSSVLPEYPRIEKEGDLLEQCLAACRKYGVACHVWKICFNIGWREDMRMFCKKMSDEGRTQVRTDNKDGARWLCPSDPRNRQYEIDAMVELSQKEGVAGVHFDYIRYSTDKACYCNGCRERFERSLGRKIARWPQDIKGDPDISEQWRKWRVANITVVVAGASKRIRSQKPGVKISAAVFSNPETAPNMVAQDWLDWCRKGYLDFVCPMNYLNSAVLQRATTQMQLKAVAGLPVKVYPGIGLSVFKKDGCDARRLSEQIVEIRECGAPGFSVFNFDKRALDALPQIFKNETGGIDE